MIGKFLSFVNYAGSIAAIFTFVGFMISKVRKLHVQIQVVSDLKNMRDDMLGFYVKTGFSVVDDKRMEDRIVNYHSPIDCNLANNSSSMRHVFISGHVFHFGSVLAKDAVGFWGIKGRDFCCACSILQKEVYIHSGSSELVHLDYKSVEEVSLQKSDRSLARCICIGSELQHDVVVLSIKYGGFLVDRVYFDATDNKIISFCGHICILKRVVSRWFRGLRKVDYNVIPDAAYTSIDIVMRGLQNVDFSGKTTLSNFGDDETSSFYRYFCENACLPFKCLDFKRCELPFSADMLLGRQCHVYGINEAGMYDNRISSEFVSDEAGTFVDGDFRASSFSKLLTLFNFVTTCPSSEFFKAYVERLLDARIDFKILGVYDDIYYFGNALLIDGDIFDAYFYVPLSFVHSDDDGKHRIYFHKSDNGEPMIKVKNCCWFVPNYESK